MIKEDVRKGFVSTIYNYIGMLFEKVVTVFVTVYVIRKLPIAEFGVYNLFQDTVSLVAVIFSFGIPSLIERFLPELYERGLFKDLQRWVYRALVAKLILGTSGALICLFGRHYLGSFLNADNFADLYPIFSIGLVFSILNQASQTILDTFLLQRRRNVIRIIVSLLRATLYASALALGFGLTGILWAFSISAIVGSLLFIWTIAKIKYPENVEENYDGLGELTGRFKRYAGYSYFNEVGGLILSRRVDNYMISAYLNTAAVGIYSFAARLVEMFTALSPLRVGNLIISTILFRQFTETPTQEFLQRRFTLLSKLSFYLTLPFLIILIGLRTQITEIIDPRYIEAADLLALIALFESLGCFSYPIAWMAQSTEKVEVQLYSKIGAIYNILSAIILIPRFGPLGAAWATGTSAVMKNTLMYIFLRRHLPLRFPWFDLGKLALAGTLTLALLEVAHYYAKGIIVVILLSGAAILLFALFSKILNPFDQSEKTAMERAFGRKLWIL
ncbi:MAG: oligosaccharide flippase family protein [bacterium]|nr:oligosaccharide flippase family protein [bacterium]